MTFYRPFYGSRAAADGRRTADKLHQIKLNFIHRRVIQLGTVAVLPLLFHRHRGQVGLVLHIDLLGLAIQVNGLIYSLNRRQRVYAVFIILKVEIDRRLRERIALRGLRLDQAVQGVGIKLEISVILALLDGNGASRICFVSHACYVNKFAVLILPQLEHSLWEQRCVVPLSHLFEGKVVSGHHATACTGMCKLQPSILGRCCVANLFQLCRVFDAVLLPIAVFLPPIFIIYINVTHQVIGIRQEHRFVIRQSCELHKIQHPFRMFRVNVGVQCHLIARDFLPRRFQLSCFGISRCVTEFDTFLDQSSTYCNFIWRSLPCVIFQGNIIRMDLYRKRIPHSQALR